MRIPRITMFCAVLLTTACASVFAHEDSYVATRKRWCSELAQRAYASPGDRQRALQSVPDASHPDVTCAVVLAR